MTSTVLDLFKNGALKDSGVLDHLCELIRAQLNSTNQLKNLNQIEVLSYFLRTHSFKFKQLLQDSKLRQKIYANKQYAEYVEKLNNLSQKLAKVENGKSYTMPNLNAECQALKTAGISIGETNYFYLNKAIKSLAIKNNVKEIKFWGKILGRKDYFVIQGISSNPYLNELGKDGEPYGVGANSYSYWVATDILGQWTQLPLVSPAQVKSSRDFKYVFTGNLQSSLDLLVPFKGKQKHLLKCVLARITHACYLTPKGLYKVSEADPNNLQFEESQEGFKLPQVNELATLQNWVHLPANILSHGRTTHFIDPSLPQQQAQALKAELDEKQPVSQRLKGITQDKPYDYNGYQAPGNWTAQLCGQTIPVSLIGKQQGQSAVYGVALLKNLSWPGSATVGYRGGWTSIYVGYGHRATQQLKIIKQLADLQIQGNDIQQRPEPTPLKAPVEAPPAEKAPEEPPQQ